MVLGIPQKNLCQSALWTLRLSVTLGTLTVGLRKL